MVDNDEALLSEVTDFEDRRYDAMVRGDAASLAGMFDKGLIYTHSSGVRQDAADYLRGLAAGADVYRQIEHGIDRTVRLANSVLVYGWQRMTVHRSAKVSLGSGRGQNRWAMPARIPGVDQVAVRYANAGAVPNFVLPVKQVGHVEAELRLPDVPGLDRLHRRQVQRIITR